MDESRSSVTEPIMPCEQCWKLNLEYLFQLLDSSPIGLNSRQANERYARLGPNILNPSRKRLVLQFLLRFKNPLVLLLLAASLVSAITGDVTSFFIIMPIVIISVSLDFIQEYRAERAAEELRHSVALKATVYRNEAIIELDVAQIVVGDIVLLSAGDLIPADGRVIEANDFFVNQALLTGETYPIEKHAIELADNEIDFGNATNAVFTGTSVISGSAKVLICTTGAQTALGEIGDALTRKSPATAFERGIRDFGLQIVWLTSFLVLFVLLVNLFLHRPWLESFLFALALAVGLTPELLPMIVTVTLARGAMRMSKQHVIVKQLAAIHNLGSMDVLCTDKTETLTEAKIQLERHVNCQDQNSEHVLQMAYLNSYFETGLKSPLDEAILQRKTLDVSTWCKIDEVPFDFERRRVSVLLEKDKNRVLVVKGAPEDILRLCSSYEYTDQNDIRPISPSELQQLETQSTTLAQQGFRVLGIAWKSVPPEHSHAVVNDESELVFAGFVAFFDPPKASAKSALIKLEKNGIEIKIVSGDNELVTQHVCAQLGIPVHGVLIGRDIAKMDDHALQAMVEKTNLFCRVTPALKSRVLLALKQRGHTVGFLGDGINDAPALHIADVSISVDSAVDVAKDAAELILLRQDLHVLHQGVLEGRRTFGNIMKYVMMATSSNFGNMFSMAGAAIFLPFLPMLPTQILLNNLLYDVSETTIPLDNVNPEDLKKPHQWNMKFIRNFMFVFGPISSIFDFLTFYFMLVMLHANESLFHTGWFIESIATQVLVIFIIRTRHSLFKSRPNIWLTVTSLSIVIIAIILPFTAIGNYFGFVPLPPVFFILLIGTIITYLLIVEQVKRWFYRRLVKNGR